MDMKHALLGAAIAIAVLAVINNVGMLAPVANIVNGTKSKVV